MILNRYQQNEENGNYNDSEEYDNYQQNSNSNRFPINANKTSFQFYPKNKKRVEFDFEEYNDNNYNNNY